jgi:hypothetical protein
MVRVNSTLVCQNRSIAYKSLYLMRVIVQYHAPPTIDGTDSHGNVYFKVPRPANCLFTGRVELLVRIKAILHSDNTASYKQQRRFVITGLGGQGKSEICLQVANSLKEEYIHYEEVLIVYQLTEIASGAYFGSTPISLPPLSVTLSPLQSYSGTRLRLSLKHFKSLQLHNEAGSSSSIMPMTRSLTTRSTFHLGITVLFS